MFKASFITPLEKIQEELAEMQSFLEQPVTESATDLTTRLEVLMQHMARSGKLKSDAEYHYNGVMSSSIIDALKTAVNLTPSTLNKYVDSLCKDYKQMVVWSDRVNRSCTHQIDATRTLISYAKSEMSFR